MSKEHCPISSSTASNVHGNLVAVGDLGTGQFPTCEGDNGAREQALQTTITSLREEVSLLRGVLDVLRVDLQIKDDQIDRVSSTCFYNDC